MLTGVPAATAHHQASYSRSTRQQHMLTGVPAAPAPGVLHTVQQGSCPRTTQLPGWQRLLLLGRGSPWLTLVRCLQQVLAQLNRRFIHDGCIALQAASAHGSCA
jgi:hypothetical protein